MAARPATARRAARAWSYSIAVEALHFLHHRQLWLNIRRQFCFRLILLAGGPDDLSNFKFEGGLDFTANNVAPRSPIDNVQLNAARRARASDLCPAGLRWSGLVLRIASGAVVLSA